MSTPESYPDPLPQIDEYARRAAARAELKANLEVAMMLAKQMTAAAEKCFPDAARDVKQRYPFKLAELSFDQKMALGDTNIANLQELAFAIAPLASIDQLEKTLPDDVASAMASAAVIDGLRKKPNPR